MMTLMLATLVAILPHLATAETETTCEAQSATISCDTGDVLDASEPCMIDCTACSDDCSAPGSCSDFCNADRCCYTPHEVAGTELTADATSNNVLAALTDTDYKVTWERYEDDACTQPAGEYIDGLPISGRSATCISQINGPEEDDPTPFGWYGYCPGETGNGYYEYTLTPGASQCPSGSTAKGTYEGPYAVNTCVCVEEEEENGATVCTEWGKLSCTSCDTEGADCPVLLEDKGANASNAMRNVVGATVALLVLLPTM